MKFGLFGSATARRGGPDLDSGQGFREYVDYTVEADALGYSSIFVVEHHFTGYGQVSASLNLLTWVAARTKDLRLGTAVIVLPWHNPVLLAEQAATIDLLSGGRLDFGIGKGYRHAEFASFCIPQEEADARFDESLEVILKAWTSEERFSHHGRYWHFEDIIVEPPTAQKPHPPIWMAAGNLEFDPQGRAARLQAPARPARLDRSHHRALQHLQGRGREAGPALRSHGCGGGAGVLRRAQRRGKGESHRDAACQPAAARQGRQRAGRQGHGEPAVVRPDARCRRRERDVRHAGRDRGEARGAARGRHRASAAERPDRLAREPAGVRARADAGVLRSSGRARRRAAPSRSSSPRNRPAPRADRDARQQHPVGSHAGNAMDRAARGAVARLRGLAHARHHGDGGQASSATRIPTVEILFFRSAIGFLFVMPGVHARSARAAAHLAARHALPARRDRHARQRAVLLDADAHAARGRDGAAVLAAAVHDPARGACCWARSWGCGAGS